MAIKMKFDLVGNPEPPTIILANRNGNKLGQLKVDELSIDLSDKFNEASEFSFTLNKYINDEPNYLWDKVVNFKLVYCKEWDMWFEITVELDEKTETVKTVFCTQLGQAELSQIMLYNVEINTENDIARDDYKIAILYDVEDSKASILGRLFDKAPHYSIKHVDETIANIQRTFSFDGTSVYDACQEVAQEIGCFFDFHSDSDENGMPRRIVSVYDLHQNCENKDCKYRGEYTDVCPKCGSNDIKVGYGEDTLIYVTSDELASNGIRLTTDTDSVKNCFKLEAGDDLMTATIRNRNPNGSDYIWYFSDAMKEDMPDEMVRKLEEYDKVYQYYYTETEDKPDELILDNMPQKPFKLNDSLLNGYNNLVDKYLMYNKELEKIDEENEGIKGFSALMEAYYNTIDLGWYLKSGLMPNIEMAETNAVEQCDLLSISLPSLIAVANLDSVSKPTADNAVLTMAKAIVSSHYKVTIERSDLTGSNWSGIFTVTNYSDEEDTWATGTISRYLADWDETYIKQKIDKILSKENTDDLSITGVFEKELKVEKDKNENLVFSGEFWDELHKYALNPLISFRNACEACIDILIEQGVGSEDSKGYIENESYTEDDPKSEPYVIGNLYDCLYLPFYNKLKAIEAEIKVRESEVNLVLGVYDKYNNLVADGLQTNIEDFKAQIQAALNFQNYLGEDLWLEFCAYRREDKYSNSNYISDGLNNAELFERALEFYEVAENEIFKSSELQHSISATLNNLLAIPKFKPLVDSFKVGNWIRVKIDDEIYKLRLLEYQIDYSDFNNIAVTFSDVSKIKNGITDVEDILSEASSMASSYDSVQRQATQGNEARNAIRQWMSEGLNAANVRIQNNTTEDITIDNKGILGRSYSDIIGDYSPEQVRFTHNIMAYTDDNWASVKQAIGKNRYRYYENGAIKDGIGYGMTAEYVSAGYISGSQIIGGDIYSDNYSLDAEACTNCGYAGDFGKEITEETDDNGDVVYKTTFTCPKCKGINTNRKGTGSYIDLREGTFSLGGGRLTFNGKGELRIQSPDMDGLTEADVKRITTTVITDTSVTTEKLVANNLIVNGANVNGTLTAITIESGNVKSGTLIGNDIKGGSLYIGDTSYVDPEDEDYENTSKDANYTLIEGGKLTCNSANITGGRLYIGDTTDTETDTKWAKIENGTLTCNSVNITGGYLSIGGKDSDGNPISAYITPNYISITGNITANNISANSGSIGGCNIVDGKLQVPVANIAGTLTAQKLQGDEIEVWNNGDEAKDIDPTVTAKITPGSSTASGLSITTSGAVYLASKACRIIMNEPIYEEGSNEPKVDEDGVIIRDEGVVVIGANLRGKTINARTAYLGLEDCPWETVYIRNSPIVTSDQNYKNSIEDLNSEYSTFFNSLAPKRFKYNDGTSDRYHVGFIAQEVEDALYEAGLDTQQFAGFVRGNDEENEICYLRYEEFIALNVQQTQQLKNKVSALEEQINMLTKKLEELEA